MLFVALFWYLWIAPHLLLAMVLVLLFRRGLCRQFPIFLAYLAFEILDFLVLFAMAVMRAATAKEYAVAYAFGLAISTALQFGVVYEICAHLFRNYTGLSRFGRPLFRWLTVGLFLGSVLASVGSGGRDVTRMVSVVHVLEFIASVLFCGLLVVIFALSSYLNLSWRSYLFGIALGLGIFSSVGLATSAIRAQTGFTYNRILDYFIMGTYHCCVLIWTYYLWAPERSSQYAVKVLPETDLEIWNQELQRLIEQ